MIKFIDEKGKKYSALTSIKRKKAVNGEKSLSGTIFRNKEVINNVDLGWRVEFEEERYVITYAQPIDNGNVVELQFDAVHEFFYDFLKSSIHETLNGSHTMRAYLDFVFDGSGYSYLLDATIKAFEKENFGMQNRLALFNNLINTSGAEFVVNGRVVRIVTKVGKDLSTVVRKGFNMQDIRIEKNIKDFITYRKGYGAFFDEEDESLGRLEAEYTSPLLAIYGKLEGDPFIDERYSVEENLYNKIKDSVDNSYEISVQLTMEDLTKAGYKYKQPHEGDFIMAINEDLGFMKKIRIISYESEFDTSGQLIDHQVVCGSEGLVSTSSDAKFDKIYDDLDKIQADINYVYIAANGKNMIYRGPDEPINNKLVINDVWYKSVGDGEHVMHLWTGAYWEEVTLEDARFNNLDANAITTGTLRGSLFSLDLDTGRLLIGKSETDYSLYFDGSSLKIRLASGKTVEQEIDDGVVDAKLYTDSEVAAFDSTITGFQDQLDGKITTWYYGHNPTASNAPAYQWTTTAIRDQHVGDLFYNINTGKVFRYKSTHTWEELVNEDITAALATASEAKDTADYKRRVFTSTPYVPYDKGDLWAGGSGVELKMARYSRSANSSYYSSDWVPASSATDSVLNGKANKATLITEINADSSGWTIQGNKINLVGAVTVLSDITGNLGLITAGTILIGDSFMVNSDGWLYAGKGGFSVPPDADGIYNQFLASGSYNFAARWKYDDGNYIYQDANELRFYIGTKTYHTFKKVGDHTIIRLGVENSRSSIIKSLGSADRQVQFRDGYDSGYIPVGASDFRVGSSRKFKEDIKPCCDSKLKLVKNTPIYNFKFKKDESKKINTGFIVEESPDSITATLEEEDTKQGISLMDTVATLWKAVQELSSEVDVLKNRVTELEKEEVV